MADTPEGPSPMSLTDPSTWSLGWSVILVPNAAMLYMHHRGGTLRLVEGVLRTTGVWGLFAVPFLGLAAEKAFYDTALSLQGVDPCQQREDRKGEGFPAGGHMLPSLSLVPVRNVCPSMADVRAALRGVRGAESAS